jgi:hypothetical protein
VLGVAIKQERHCNVVNHKMCKGIIYLSEIKTATFQLVKIEQTNSFMK